MTAARTKQRGGERPAKAPRPTQPPRDQATSSFTMILDRLVVATPSARGAALVDFEGETVDYAGKVDPFELKVAAATWQIALSEIDSTALAGARQITVHARRSGFVLRRVTSEYALVLVVHARAAFAVSERALAEAEAALAVEAGFASASKTRRAWFSVSVRAEAEHRPSQLFVADKWQPIEVIGSVMGLHDRERGYRVRLPSGVEMMLVRERNGLWFCDEPVAARAHEAARSS